MSKTPEYEIWHAMWQRCTNPNYRRFDRYGGRGIVVCERWERFENFYADMGPRPTGRTLDRIDNEGNYEPTNCRWATWHEQSINKAKRRRRTHCKRGHELTPESTIVWSNGDRGCRTCRNDGRNVRRQRSNKPRVACPHCDRTFSMLARHIISQHPDMVERA